MADPEGGGRLEIERVLPAPPERVWAAWTDAAGMRRWMCPGTVEEARVELDVREGGSFRVDMIDGDTTYRHTGRYLTVDPPRRLSFTWVSPATGNAESVVTVELRPAGDGTTLTLVHERLPSAESAERHREGWGSILEKLQGALQA